MTFDRFRVYDADGVVVTDGAASAAGVADFSSPGPVARVVFYAGEPDVESVVAVVDQNGKSGDFSVTPPEVGGA
jgi:hypothetical protein